MTRRKRIALELLGPSFLGAALWDLALGIEFLADGIKDGFASDMFIPALQTAAVILPFAYIVAGLPSILYALIMERCFARGLSPTGWRMVRLSTLLGFFSGAAMALALNPSELGTWLVLSGTGLVVGFALGLIIKVLSGRTSSAETKH